MSKKIDHWGKTTCSWAVSWVNTDTTPYVSLGRRIVLSFALWLEGRRTAKRKSNSPEAAQKQYARSSGFTFLSVMASLVEFAGGRLCSAVLRWIHISICERSWTYGSILPARESLDNVELFSPRSAPTLHRTTVTHDNCHGASLTTGKHQNLERWACRRPAGRPKIKSENTKGKKYGAEKQQTERMTNNKIQSTLCGNKRAADEEKTRQEDTYL